MCDLARDAPDPLERQQADPDHDPSQRNEPEDHAAAHERLDLDQPLKRLLDVTQRNRDQKRPTVLDSVNAAARYVTLDPAREFTVKRCMSCELNLRDRESGAEAPVETPRFPHT